MLVDVVVACRKAPIHVEEVVDVDGLSAVQGTRRSEKQSLEALQAYRYLDPNGLLEHEFGHQS